MSRRLQLAFLAVAAVVVAELLVRDRPPSGPQAGLGVDVDAATAPAAPELVLSRLDGTPVDLKSLRGKVVAVNFWATWCGPCLKEMPELAELWRSRHGRCFELLGVAGMSGREDTEQLASRVPYPVLFDQRGEATDAWSVSSFPRTFVLDTRGRIRQVFRGMVAPEQLAQAVDALLPPSCPAPG